MHTIFRRSSAFKTTVWPVSFPCTSNITIKKEIKKMAKKPTKTAYHL